MRKIVIILCIVLITITCMNLSGETVKIIGVNGEVKVLRFNTDSKEIILEKTIHKIRTIKGLSHFRNLKKLSIGFSDLRETDFSFLEEIRGLEVLELYFATLKDVDFISKIPSLIAFRSDETMSIENFNIINLEGSKKLEYFGVFTDGIDNIPEFINIPDSLKYIDFNYTIFDKLSLKNLSLLASYKNINYLFNDEIENCIRRMKLDINLYDSSKYNELLKHYNL